MKLPTLYCKNKDGSIQEWTISVRQTTDGTGIIETVYGRVNGALQTTTDTITEGKNVGKKNATTPYQQAQKEAKSKWTKQKKLGYVESVDDAQADKVDAVIQGGVDPMLAHGFDKHSSKVTYPCYVQPKLDGVRCIAMVKTENGRTTCTLWSRTRKQITSMGHIALALESQFSGQTVVLDGELYNHELHADFESLVSHIRKDEPTPEAAIIHYHIYDVVLPNKPYSERKAWLDNAFRVFHGTAAHNYLKLVETTAAADYNGVWKAHDHFCEEGYEGAIVRNSFGTYVGNRSYNLLKVKTFVDEEFELVGCEEGRGNLAGHIGAFICKLPNGESFKTSMDGKRVNLKRMFNTRDWMGKKLTVRFQNYTKDGKPRFPKGKVIRDYE